MTAKWNVMCIIICLAEIFKGIKWHACRRVRPPLSTPLYHYRLLVWTFLFFCFFLKTTFRHSHLPDTVTAQRCEVLTGLNFSPKLSFLHLPHDRHFNGEYFDLSKQTKALCTYKAICLSLAAEGCLLLDTGGSCWVDNPLMYLKPLL